MEGKFYTALKTANLIPELGSKEVTEEHILLADAAEQVDSTTRRLAEQARYLAEVCSRFAVDVEEGTNSSTPPTAYSATNDITTYTAQLTAQKTALFTLIRVVYDLDSLKKYKKTLQSV